MATYILLSTLLSTLTDAGAETLTKHTERLKEVNQALAEMGMTVTAQYAVFGPYDCVTIVEAPDNTTNATMARVSAKIAARGSVKIMTLAALPINACIASLQ